MLEFGTTGAFSPDGSLVALAGADGIVRVWEIASGKQVGSLDAGWASSLAFAPRGGLLAAMTWDGYVAVARAPWSIPLRTGWTPTLGCGGLEPSASPDGRWVATGARGGAAIWRTDGSLVQVLRPPARSRTGIDASELAFSGDGADVAVSAATATCGVLSQTDRFGAAVWRIGRPAASSPLWPARYSSGGLALGPDGSLVATGRRAWRPATGKRVRALDGILALSGDGRLALVGRKGVFDVVEVPSAHPVARLAGPVRDTEDLTAAFGADGSRVLTDDWGILRLWDAHSGELVARIDRKGQVIDTFRFSRDGRRILAVFGEHVAVFDAATGERLARVPVVLGALSDDGMFAAQPRRDGTVDVVDVKTGVRVNLPTDTTTPIDSVAFGATSDVLLLGDENGDAHVLRCPVCASDEEVVARAKASLERQSHLRRARPPEVTQVA
jgi:WD40 repeat protein